MQPAISEAMLLEAELAALVVVVGRGLRHAGALTGIGDVNGTAGSDRRRNVEARLKRAADVGVRLGQTQLQGQETLTGIPRLDHSGRFGSGCYARHQQSDRERGAEYMLHGLLTAFL